MPSLLLASLLTTMALANNEMPHPSTWQTLPNGFTSHRSLLGGSGSTSGYEASFLDGSETYYNDYAQAWRLLGFYTDCNAPYNNYNECSDDEQGGQEQNRNDGDDSETACQRYLLWAAVCSHNMNCTQPLTLQYSTLTPITLVAVFRNTNFTIVNTLDGMTLRAVYWTVVGAHAWIVILVTRTGSSLVSSRNPIITNGWNNCSNIKVYVCGRMPNIPSCRNNGIHGRVRVRRRIVLPKTDSSCITMPSRSPKDALGWDCIPTIAANKNTWATTSKPFCNKRKVSAISNPTWNNGMMPLMCTSCVNLARRTIWDSIPIIKAIDRVETSTVRTMMVVDNPLMYVHAKHNVTLTHIHL